MHPYPVTHLTFPINMSPQTPLCLFLQLTMDQLVQILRYEADKDEYVHCHCLVQILRYGADEGEYVIMSIATASCKFLCIC